MNQSLRGAGPVNKAILDALSAELTPVVARAVLRGALTRARLTPRQLERRGLDRGFVDVVARSVRIHSRDLEQRRRCKQRLEQLEASGREARAQPPSVFEIRSEDDIVSARNHARTRAGSLGFDPTSCVKLATVVSELARNMYRYAGGGRIELRTSSGPRRAIQILAEDQGAGIPNLELVLSGEYRSKTGMGLGLLACKRLMDEFEVTSGPEGTRVSTCKYLP